MSAGRSRRPIAAAVALAAALQTGCTITHEISSEKREIYHFTPDFGVSDAQFRRSLDTLNSVVVGGNSARILKNGDEMFPAMTGEILIMKASLLPRSWP